MYLLKLQMARDSFPLFPFFHPRLNWYRCFLEGVESPENSPVYEEVRALEDRKAGLVLFWSRFVCNCVFVCMCVSVCACINLWGLLLFCILAFPHMVIIQKQAWDTEPVNEFTVFHHSKANVGLTQDEFGTQHPFLRVNLIMALDEYSVTSILAALFWNALTCFAEKSSEEYCLFTSKKRSKKQWGLAFVSTIINWKAQSHTTPCGSLHIH